MTFYNVLSALLFIGTLRAVFVAIEQPNWSQIFISGSLVILVFNDMLSTSYQVETKGEVEYSIQLMLVDLLNFLLLALALIVISPDKNLFDISLPRVAAFLGAASFWHLLLLYWLMLMTWTRVSLGKKQPKARFRWQCSIAAVFLVQWVLSLLGPSTLVKVGNVVVFFYLLVYLTIIRRLVRSRERVAA